MMKWWNEVTTESDVVGVERIGVWKSVRCFMYSGGVLRVERKEMQRKKRRIDEVFIQFRGVVEALRHPKQSLMMILIKWDRFKKWEKGTRDHLDACKVEFSIIFAKVTGSWIPEDNTESNSQMKVKAWSTTPIEAWYEAFSLKKHDVVAVQGLSVFPIPIWIISFVE